MTRECTLYEDHRRSLALLFAPGVHSAPQGSVGVCQDRRKRSSQLRAALPAMNSRYVIPKDDSRKKKLTAKNTQHIAPVPVYTLTLMPGLPVVCCYHVHEASYLRAGLPGLSQAKCTPKGHVTSMNGCPISSNVVIAHRALSTMTGPDLDRGCEVTTWSRKMTQHTRTHGRGG